MADANLTDRARHRGAGGGLRNMLGDELVVAWGERGFHVCLMLALVGFAAATNYARSPWFGTVIALVPLLLAGLTVKWVAYGRDVAVGVVGTALGYFALWTMSRMLGSPVDPAPVSTMFVLMPLAAAIAPAIWSRPFTSSGISVLLGQLVVVWGAGMSVIVGTVVALVATLAGIVVVNVARGGGRVWLGYMRARARSHFRVAPLRRSRPDDARAVARMSRDNLRRGEKAEAATGAALETLPDRWRVMHSRALPGTAADADHILVGAGGVLLVDTKDWNGTITEHPRPYDPGMDGAPAAQSVTGERMDDGRIVEYGISGRPERMRTLLATAYDELTALAEPLGLDLRFVRVVVAFTSRMTIPDGVLAAMSGTSLHVDLVHQDQLAGHIESLPALRWLDVGADGEAQAAKEGVDVEVIRLRRQTNYLTDLGSTIDYMCPRKG